MLARVHYPALGWLFVVALTTMGCSPSIDLAKALQVTDVSTGWFDMGVVDGKNKLVPSVTFSLRNSEAEALNVQMNVVFAILPEKEERDDVFLNRVEVPAAGAAKPITIRSKYGFTGEQPRADMLQHRMFQDFEVRLFAKRGSSQWVRLGDYRVARQLLTR